MKILRLIGILPGIIIGILGFSLSGVGGLILWIIAALLIIQGIPQAIEIFQKTKEKSVDISEEALDKITEAVMRRDETTQQLQEFLGSLPSTDNEQLKTLVELGQKEQARAEKIADAIRRGDKEEAKQYAEATRRAIDYYRQGLSANPKTSERCTLYNLIGQAHYNISEVDEAASMWEDAVQIAQEMVYDENKKIAREGQIALAIALGNLGTISEVRGDLIRAEEYYSEALRNHSVLGRKDGIASCLINLGIVYQKLGDLERSKEMQLHALDIHKELGNKAGIASGYSNLGVLYANNGNPELAEKMCLKALDINDELDRKEDMVNQYNNLGNIYLISSDLDSAEEMYLLALRINKELGSKEGMATNYNNLGSLYKRKENIKQAEYYYRLALKLFREIGAEQSIQQVIEYLKEIGREP